MRTPRLTLHMAATALSLAGCLEIPAPGSPGPHELCIKTDWIDPVEVPGCLGQAHLIDAVDESTAVALVSATIQLRDSLLGDPAASSSGKAAELTRALSHLSQYYARDLFADTARFHRMLDHVAVTGEYVRGKVLWVGGRAWPIATPWLSWAYYFDVGIFFHVVNTVHAVVYPIPQPSVPDDSVLSIAEQIYQYALWRHHGPTRFPVWEYQFTWNSGGVQVRAPWISGLGQAHALMLFGECFRRSHDVVWMQRGAEVLGSFMTLWDDGGTLLPDTTHGYWWEEFHPAVRVFNGAAWAVVSLGIYSEATGDSVSSRLFGRGLEAIKHYAQEYDTGEWTLYSRTQGYATIDYHNLHVQLMDILHTLSGDPWFKETADRWRAYQPPPGVR
jgi:hypothetical protein